MLFNESSCLDLSKEDTRAFLFDKDSGQNINLLDLHNIFILILRDLKGKVWKISIQIPCPGCHCRIKNGDLDADN